MRSAGPDGVLFSFSFSNIVFIFIFLSHYFFFFYKCVCLFSVHKEFYSIRSTSLVSDVPELALLFNKERWLIFFCERLRVCLFSPRECLGWGEETRDWSTFVFVAICSRASVIRLCLVFVCTVVFRPFSSILAPAVHPK